MLFIFVLECPSQLRLGYLHLNILKSESTNSTKEEEEEDLKDEIELVDLMEFGSKFQRRIVLG